MPTLSWTTKFLWSLPVRSSRLSQRSALSALADLFPLTAVQLTLADFLLKLDRPTPSPPPSLSTSLQEPVNHLQSQSSNLGSNRTPLLPQEPAFYLQSQSSNLGSPSSPTPLTPLLADLGSSIAGPSFAREVFETQPDATNLWIGDQRSVTSLHKDPYENLYLVIRGVKEFVLLPPTEFYCLHGESIRSSRRCARD